MSETWKQNGDVKLIFKSKIEFNSSPKGYMLTWLNVKTHRRSGIGT
jgi:hypothetical protein